MNSWFRFCVFLSLCVAAMSFRTPFEVKTSQSAKDELPQLRRSLDHLVAQFDQKMHIGIEIISLDNGQKIYAKNAYHMFTPASVQKLYTAAAALALLGVNYTFETLLEQDGMLDGNILKGNLYLKGSGDPNFSVRELQLLSQNLVKQGIKEVQGEIVLDNTVFDDLTQGPGWMWDEPPAYWAARVDGLTLNRNCIKVTLTPSKEIATAPHMAIEPETRYMRVELASGTERTTCDKLECKRKETIPFERIVLQGPIGDSSKELFIAVAQPSHFVQTVFEEILQQTGIRFKSVRFGKVPRGSVVMGRHASVPLSLIVREMMKTSDNLIANCLFKKMGGHMVQGEGSWKNGSKAVREFLAEQIGIDQMDITLLDGDGQSRYNLTSPHHLVSLLLNVKKQPYYPEFLASLPIAGIDSKHSELKGKVRAKPGTMTGVTSLAGYVDSQGGETFAFAIMVNGFTGPEDDIKEQLEEKICQLLANFSREIPETVKNLE